MELSTFLIAAVALTSALMTAMLWIRVRRKVHTDEHAIAGTGRADPSDSRIAYPADEASPTG